MSDILEKAKVLIAIALDQIPWPDISEMPNDWCYLCETYPIHEVETMLQYLLNHEDEEAKKIIYYIYHETMISEGPLKYLIDDYANRINNSLYGKDID